MDDMLATNRGKMYYFKPPQSCIYVRQMVEIDGGGDKFAYSYLRSELVLLSGGVAHLHIHQPTYTK